jgi:alkyl hydroperoxide reductase subunit D
MPTLEDLSGTLPDSARDLRLNLQSVLQNSSLTPAQTWSVALASAWFVQNRELAEALVASATGLSEADVDDAKAAAALMGMTTVYYRFRHLVHKESYSQKRPGLRMNRMAQPLTSREQFEMCAMACAALAGCETCIGSHEDSLLKAQVSEDQIHDVVRIASAVNGFAVALATRP